MKRTIGLTLAALAVMAIPAAAQMYGNPVYVPVGMGTGVNIAGDYARGMNDASFKTNYFGARATLGLSAFYVSAGIGSVKGDSALTNGADGQTAFGGSLGYHIIRLPMTPVKVTAQAGAGYLKEGDFKQLDVPIAVALGLSLPGPLGITPWIAPRLHIRTQDDGTESQTDTRFGASGGVNVSIGMIGIHVAADYVSFSAPEGSGLSASDFSPWRVGAGLSLGISPPGL